MRGAGPGQFAGPAGHAVLRQHPGQRAEAVGLDDVAAHLEERPVDWAIDFGPGDAQHLVATLEDRSAEVVLPQAQSLQVGPRGAVEDDDAVMDSFDVSGGIESHRLDGTG